MAAAGSPASVGFGGTEACPVELTPAATESVSSTEAPAAIPSRRRRGLIEIELGGGSVSVLSENVDGDALGSPTMKSCLLETVRRRLAENHLKPWRKDMWCIPKIDGNTGIRYPSGVGRMLVSMADRNA